MYVYRANSADTKFTVGFYTPSGEWIVEEDYEKKAEAESKVSFLNGGSGVAPTAGPFFALGHEAMVSFHDLLAIQLLDDDQGARIAVRTTKGIFTVTFKSSDEAKAVMHRIENISESLGFLKS